MCTENYFFAVCLEFIARDSWQCKTRNRTCLCVRLFAVRNVARLFQRWETETLTFKSNEVNRQRNILRYFKGRDRKYFHSFNIALLPRFKIFANTFYVSCLSRLWIPVDGGLWWYVSMTIAGPMCTCAKEHSNFTLVVDRHTMNPSICVCIYAGQHFSRKHIIFRPQETRSKHQRTTFVYGVQWTRTTCTNFTAFFAQSDRTKLSVNDKCVCTFAAKHKAP